MFFDFILCLCELKLFLVLWSCLISNVFAIAAGPWNTNSQGSNCLTFKLSAPSYPVC